MTFLASTFVESSLSPGVTAGSGNDRVQRGMATSLFPANLEPVNQSLPTKQHCCILRHCSDVYSFLAKWPMPFSLPPIL